TDSDIGAGNPSGWYYDVAGTWTYATGVTFSQGEGMIVQNNHSVGANFVISGEVDLAPALILPKGVSFSGNFTPVDMGLQDIQCVQTNGAAWARSGTSATKCNGLVSLQKTDADGNFLTNYKYFSTDSDIGAGNPSGWYYDVAGTWTYATGVTFKSGEGFIIQNNHSVGAKLVLKSPISE
ncbi:MAG: hypothetical protein IKJ45_11560, partial [Kiritimatiellae bacterium]|nr:hypothetical protein [Kiritimatiellia bacterium]